MALPEPTDKAFLVYVTLYTLTPIRKKIGWRKDQTGFWSGARELPSFIVSDVWHGVASADDAAAYGAHLAHFTQSVGSEEGTRVKAIEAIAYPILDARGKTSDATGRHFKTLISDSEIDSYLLSVPTF